MPTSIGGLLSRNKRFVPLAVTIVMLLLAYGFGAYHYAAMREPQVFFNLFRNYPFLLISAVGMTFVIISGGIDLSVSGVVALTTVVVAALLRAGWDAWAVIGFVLAMGTLYGALMGSFITYLKVQPFIATLAGMWIARGMCFFISDDAIPIRDRTFRILARTKILIPGLADPDTKTGAFVSFLVVAAIVVLLVAIYVAHYTRFGRTVYALGGNERSAQLMGLPVQRTKVLVYTISGFCSALAGVTLSISVMSGHGLYASNFEMDVIASVVMGGAPLSGGTGYVFGTLLGVLVNIVIQSIIQFNGQLSSWWTKIVIGALTLMFIGVQSYMLTRKGRAKQRTAARADRSILMRRRRKQVVTIAAAAAVLLVAVRGVNRWVRQATGGGVEAVAVQGEACQDPPLRTLGLTVPTSDGAPVIVFERNGGPRCVGEVFTVFADGRVVADDGKEVREERSTPAEVAQVLAEIDGLGWFSDELYDTWHTRCRECYGYAVTVASQGRVKQVKGVDGGTDAPARYWDAVKAIHGLVRKEKER
ncbi:MAG TPA: galactofuranose ABC transporter, permease protein YjfF [Anaeromyxobacter sp.]|nr:galactofuranose ABC transporter, permease protein YjfF [Anaeromyxobacter sp.]